MLYVSYLIARVQNFKKYAGQLYSSIRSDNERAYAPAADPGIWWWGVGLQAGLWITVGKLFYLTV